MDMEKLISRLNFLYHKRQTEGLTETEQLEQTELRREYIDIIKGNVKTELNRVQFVDLQDNDCNHSMHCCDAECKTSKH